MRLTSKKTCSCCKEYLTTKKLKSIGRNSEGLWLNCLKCKSTLLLPQPRKYKAIAESTLDAETIGRIVLEACEDFWRSNKGTNARKAS